MREEVTISALRGVLTAGIKLKIKIKAKHLTASVDDEIPFFNFDPNQKLLGFKYHFTYKK